MTDLSRERPVAQPEPKEPHKQGTAFALRLQDVCDRALTADKVSAVVGHIAQHNRLLGLRLTGHEPSARGGWKDALIDASEATLCWPLLRPDTENNVYCTSRKARCRADK